MCDYSENQQPCELRPTLAGQNSLKPGAFAMTMSFSAMLDPSSSCQLLPLNTRRLCKGSLWRGTCGPLCLGEAFWRLAIDTCSTLGAAEELKQVAADENYGRESLGICIEDNLPTGQRMPTEGVEHGKTV